MRCKDRIIEPDVIETAHPARAVRNVEKRRKIFCVECAKADQLLNRSGRPEVIGEIFMQGNTGTSKSEFKSAGVVRCNRPGAATGAARAKQVKQQFI